MHWSMKILIILRECAKVCANVQMFARICESVDPDQTVDMQNNEP